MSNHSSPSVNSYEPNTSEAVALESRASNDNILLHPHFANSPILLEKSLNFDKLDRWGKTVIRGFGWKNFVSAPRGRVNISIVREFYSALMSTSMIENTQIITVRGVVVPFSSSVINQLFEIPPVTLPHFEIKWGLNNAYDHLNKTHEAFQCLFPLFDSNHDLSTNALLPHLKAWKHFINSRVYPTWDFGSLCDNEMLLLYALAFGEYVDWEILIQRTVLEFAITRGSRGKPIPSSWMISRLCVQMNGVGELETDEIFPSRDSRVGLLPVDTPGCSSTI